MYKIIQLGAGGFGFHWTRTLQTAADIEVVALVDINQESLTETCDLYGYDPAICYTSLEEALETIPADMLLCITPPRFHYAQIARAVEAGLHVLCEKPLAESMADCVNILKVAQATNRQVAVSQQYRYRPDTQTLAKIVRQGAIGRIGQIKLDFYKGWYFDETNFRRTMPHPLLVDMAIHHFDLLRYITGLEAETVRGVSWNPPWSKNSGDTSFSLSLTLNNGAHMAYNASWVAQGDFDNWNGSWLIEGEKGSLAYKNGDIILTLANDHYQAESSETVPAIKLPLTDQQLLLADFIAAAKAGRRPATHIADNIRSIALVFAAVEAVESGRVVPGLPAEVAALL